MGEESKSTAERMEGCWGQRCGDNRQLSENGVMIRDRAQGGKQR